MTKVLASIHEENIRLRLELGDTKGFDGGSDLRIVDDTGLKIDGAIVIQRLVIPSVSANFMFLPIFAAKTAG